MDIFFVTSGDPCKVELKNTIIFAEDKCSRIDTGHTNIPLFLCAYLNKESQNLFGTYISNASCELSGFLIFDDFINEYREIADYILLEDDITVSNATKFFAYVLCFDNFENDRHKFLNYTSRFEMGKFEFNFGDIIKYDNEKSERENFKNICEAIKFEDSIDSSLYFRFEEWDDLIRFFMVRMIENNIKIKKCANCGKYFVPDKRSDTIYCNGKSPQDNKMTCKEYGTKKLWYEKMRNDDVGKMSSKIYNRLQQRARRNQNYKKYQDEFLAYSKNREEWKADIKAGNKTNEQFFEWLNKQDEQTRGDTNVSVSDKE